MLKEGNTNMITTARTLLASAFLAVSAPASAAIYTIDLNDPAIGTGTALTGVAPPCICSSTGFVSRLYDGFEAGDVLQFGTVELRWLSTFLRQQPGEEPLFTYLLSDVNVSYDPLRPPLPNPAEFYSNTVPLPSGLTFVHDLTFTIPDGRHSVQLSWFSGTYTPPVAAVPEPATWALMLLGFAGVGFMAYRRKVARCA